MFSKAAAKQKSSDHNLACNLATDVSTEVASNTSDTQLKESDPKVTCGSVNKYTNYKPCAKRSKCDADVDINLQSTSVSKRIKLDSASQRTAPKSMPHTNGVENKLSNFGSGEVAAHTEAMACNQQNKCSKGAGRNTSAPVTKEDESGACVALHSGQQQRVRVSDLDSQTIGRFEVLTASTLAARYPRKFYKHLLVQIKKQEVIAKLAWWPGNYRAVACVCCHIEPVQRRLLIMTLSTIPTYRRRGVATELMRSVIESARALSTELKDMYLHVQTSNKAALSFYRSLGFVVSREIKNYYRRLNPPDCYVLERSLCPSVSLDK